MKTNRLTKLLIGGSLASTLSFNSCTPEPPKTKQHRKILDSLEYAKIDSLNDIAYGLKEKNPEKALFLLDSLIVLSEKIGYKKGVYGSYMRKGGIYDINNKHKESAENFLKALEISEKTKDSLGIAKAHYRLGGIFYKQEKYEEAEKNYSLSISFYNSLLVRNPNSLEIKNLLSYSFQDLGSISRSKKEYGKALISYYKALDLTYQTNDKNVQASCLNNIGVIHYDNKNYDEALEYFFEGKKLNEEIDDKLKLANNLNNIAYIYKEKKDFNKALENLEKALELAEKTSDKDLIRELNHSFSEVYESLGNYKKSLEHYKTHSLLKDTLLNAESLKQVAELSTKYETEKKEKENQLLKKDVELKDAKNRQQKWGLWGLAGFLALVGASSVLLYRENKKKKLANVELGKKNKIIEEKNKDITDSIAYAKNLQQAIIPSESSVREIFPESFILYIPKDIVAGDFYWTADKKDEHGNLEKALFAACDCTGHGIPGAFMSILASSVMNHEVNNKEIYSPEKILEGAREEIIKALKSSSDAEKRKDGMDAALISLDKKTGILEFACANRPLYLIRKNEIKEYAADRMPVGFSEKMELFKKQEIFVQKDDIIYLTSDGFQDQFGGERNKKFGRKKLKEILLEIHNAPIDEQKKILEKTFLNWKKNNEQTDDVLVVGMKF